MASLKIIGGDFEKGEGTFSFGSFALTKPGHWFAREHIKSSDIESIYPASEETVKKFFGTAGMALIGGIVLGPIGALAGALVGGRKKEIAFIARLKDGRKFMATADNKTYLKIQAACL